MKDFEVIYIANVSGIPQKKSAHLPIHEANARILENPEDYLAQALLRHVETALNSMCLLQSSIFERMVCFRVMDDIASEAPDPLQL